MSKANTYLNSGNLEYEQERGREVQHHSLKSSSIFVDARTSTKHKKYMA